MLLNGLCPAPLGCTSCAGPASAEAAALAISGLTAAAALEGTAKLQPGESVAVTAAAGGTGHFAVQLALINGASKVIAIVGDDAKVAALEALDPARVQGLNRKDLDFERRLEAAVPPGGIDVVYEGVGGRLQQLLLQHLAPAGRLLQVGYISEYPHAQGYPDSQQAQQAAAQQPQQDEQQQLPPCAQLFWDRLTVTRGDQRIFGTVRLSCHVVADEVLQGCTVSDCLQAYMLSGSTLHMLLMIDPQAQAPQSSALEMISLTLTTHTTSSSQRPASCNFLSSPTRWQCTCVLALTCCVLPPRPNLCTFARISRALTCALTPASIAMPPFHSLAPHPRPCIGVAIRPQGHCALQAPRVPAAPRGSPAGLGGPQRPLQGAG